MIKSLGPALLPACACLMTPLAAEEREMEGMGRDFRRLGEPLEAPAEAEPDRPQRILRPNAFRVSEDGMGELPPEEHERLRAQLRRLMEPGEPGMPRVELDPRPVPTMVPKWRIGLGAVPVEPVLRTHLDLPKDAGLLVTELVRGGPAAEAGIERDDILVAAGDRKLAKLDDLREAVQVAGKAGRPLPLSVIHQGKRKQLKVMPVGPPAEKAEPRESAERPERVAAPRIMAEMNRRFEAMERRLNEMNRRLERQQRMIEELRNRPTRVRERRVVEPPGDAPATEADRPSAPRERRRDRE